MYLSNDYQQLQDRFAVNLLNFHNIGSGGVNSYGSSYQPDMPIMISLKRTAQWMARSSRASGYVIHKLK